MAEGQLVRIDGRRLRVTHLDRVVYPEDGTTKGEVLDYYVRISPFLLPHIAGRPVTRKRWPDGVGTADAPAAAFFAKEIDAGAPPWIPRVELAHSGGGKTYPLVDSAAALAFLAQISTIELHVPQWRVGADRQPARPDRLVLDFDPGPGTGLAECAFLAGEARRILSGMGLEAHPVTSGSAGLHVYAPLDPATGPTSEQARALARELARALEADHAGLVVSTMSKREREGRVFLDWSQNSASKTTIAPYSLRGRARPTVAAPRTWEELEDAGLAQLDFRDALARAEEAGDPLAALGFRAGARAGETGPLSSYIAKRDASRTPEPVPGNPLAAPSAPGQLPRFVIQEHHATRLHFDLRLEHGGVFVSWAVPRGLPETTDRNALAIMTEDHPLEYGSFRGTIPAGEYGAGTVTIWDEGRYELEKWRDDEIIATLVSADAGGPVGRTRIALIRTDGEGEKSSWLLHRMKTDASGRRQSVGAAPLPRPAAPERAAAPGSRVPAPTRAPVPRPMLAHPAPPGAAERLAARGGLVEIKWDGVRALAVWDGAALRLYARSGTDITARYPEVAAAASAWGDEALTLDGEIVALDARGIPSFARLQGRMHLTKAAAIAREAERTPVGYYVFDVLSRGPRDLRPERLDARRAILDALPLRSPVLAPPLLGDLDDALRAARELGLEGVVVKDPASPYRPGARSEEWLKVKLTRTQDVVIGGIRPGRGGRAGSIGSLLVGVYDEEGSLQYAGRVGSGFSDRTLARLLERTAPLRADSNPFTGVPDTDAADALWLEPTLVGEVEFAEWTPQGSLRHARWRGLRSDIAPGDVRRAE